MRLVKGCSHEALKCWCVRLNRTTGTSTIKPCYYNNLHTISRKSLTSLTKIEWFPQKTVPSLDNLACSFCRSTKDVKMSDTKLTEVHVEGKPGTGKAKEDGPYHL